MRGEGSWKPPAADDAAVDGDLRAGEPFAAAVLGAGAAAILDAILDVVVGDPRGGALAAAAAVAILELPGAATGDLTCAASKQKKTGCGKPARQCQCSVHFRGEFTLLVKTHAH